MKAAQKPVLNQSGKESPRKQKIVTPIHKFTQDSKLFNEFFFAYCSDTKQKQVSQKQRQRFQRALIKASLDSTRQYSKSNFEDATSLKNGSATDRSRKSSSSHPIEKKAAEHEDNSTEMLDLPSLGSYITLHSSRLGKQSAIVLSKILSSPEYGPIIRGLDFHENVIRDDGCIALCQTWLKGEHTRNRVYKLDFGSNDISARGLSFLIEYIIDVQAAGNLRELRLGSGKHDICVNKMDTKTAIMLAKALEINHSIRKLDLNRNIGIGRQSQKAFKCFADTFKKNRSFEEIRLGSVDMSTHSAVLILESLQHHEHLSILDLHGNGLTFEIAKPLRRIIVPHRYEHVVEEKTQEDSAAFQIESLEEDFVVRSPRKTEDVYMHDYIGMPFENEENDSDSDDELIGTDVQSSKLSVLLLEKNHIGAKGVSILYPALRKNFSLRELNLMGNFIGDEGAGFIAQYLEANNSLEFLDLQDNHISETGIVAIASALRTNYTLRSLDLSKNKCGDSGVAALGLILKDNNSIEHLNLALTGCGDAGALAMFQSLAVNYTIKTLNLSSNHLTDDSGVALEQTLKKAAENMKSKRKKSSIKHIILTGNQIDHTTLQRVKKIISKNIQSLQLQEPSKLQNELIRLKYITELLGEARLEYERCFADRRKTEAELASVKDLIEQCKIKSELELREIFANTEMEKSTIEDNEGKIEAKKMEMEKSQHSITSQLADLEEALLSYQKKRKIFQDELDACTKEYESYSELPEEIVVKMTNDVESKVNESKILSKKKETNSITTSKLLADIEAAKKKLKPSECDAIEIQFAEELQKAADELERQKVESETTNTENVNDQPENSYENEVPDETSDINQLPRSLIDSVTSNINETLNGVSSAVLI